MIKIFIVLLLCIGVYAYADTLTFKGEVVRAMPSVSTDNIQEVQDADIVHHQDGKTITINFH